VLPPGLSYVGDTSGVVPSQNGAMLTWALPDLATLHAKHFDVLVQLPSQALGTQFALQASMSTTTSDANPAQASVHGAVQSASITYLPNITLPE
jgi:hypothetical protein